MIAGTVQVRKTIQQVKLGMSSGLVQTNIGNQECGYVYLNYMGPGRL